MQESLRSRTAAHVGRHSGGIVVSRRVVSVPSPAIDWPIAATGSTTWGWLPALSLVCAFGLLLAAVAFTRARTGAAGAEPLFWASLLVPVMSVAARLVMVEPSRRERIGLVLVLGLTLYMIKVMHSPTAFTFPDEMSMLYNANQATESGRLFHENPILPVTALYPGLVNVTVALAGLSGMTTYGAGIVVMGVARLLLMLALFLLHEHVSRSARVAGIAAVLYMGNPNFVFYIAEFSYESLALPLALLVLFIVARREDERDALRRVGLTLTALLGMMAVIVSHHMTSYAVVAFLWLMTVVSMLRSRGVQPGPRGLAVIALVATSAWLVYVASLTVGYLSPVLGGAVASILRMLAGEEAGRQLFHSSSGYVAPLWERLTGIGSVLLILLGLPLGLLEIWRRHRDTLFALVLGLTAFAYFPMLGLRFTPAGWETSNRSSEFLFVGIAIVLAIALVRVRVPKWATPISYAAFTGYVAIIFLGGMTAGWQPNVRLARPYLISVGTQTVEPSGVATARWARLFLGRDNRIAVDAANAKLMLAYGEQRPYTGEMYGIHAMFFSEQVDQGTKDVLQATQVRYVVVDRRKISWDHMVGLYFPRPGSNASEDSKMIEPQVYAKFDGQRDVSRIFDGGTIVIYDVGVLSGVSSVR